MSSLKFLGISGSLRKASCNSGLLRAAQKALPAGTSLDIADLSDIPFYNADIKDKPVGVLRILDQMAAADAFVFACPEYNYSLAPALNNIIDWASREPNYPQLNDKAVAIMGAGGGMGTSRSQYHLRQVCVFLNMHPLSKPEVFSNAFAGSFDAEGNLIDPKITELVGAQMQALADWTRRLKG